MQLTVPDTCQCRKHLLEHVENDTCTWLSSSDLGVVLVFWVPDVPKYRRCVVLCDTDRWNLLVVWHSVNICVHVSDSLSHTHSHALIMPGDDAVVVRHAVTGLTTATWTPTPPQQARGEKQIWRSFGALVGCSVSLTFVLPFMNIEPSRSCQHISQNL